MMMMTTMMEDETSQVVKKKFWWKSHVVKLWILSMYFAWIQGKIVQVQYRERRGRGLLTPPS